MNKLILTGLCSAILMFAYCVPAEARITIGITPSAVFSGATKVKVDQLSKGLGNAAGTTVVFRDFDNEAVITNWLLRFQEIDAAIVTPNFIKQQPAGTLRKLVDLHSKERATTPSVLIVRSNLSNNQAELIKKSFLTLNSNQTGLDLLGNLGLAGTTLPGAILKLKRVEPKAQAAQPIIKKAPVKTEQRTAPQPSPKKKQQTTPKKTSIKEPKAESARAPETGERKTSSVPAVIIKPTPEVVEKAAKVVPEKDLTKEPIEAEKTSLKVPENTVNVVKPATKSQPIENVETAQKEQKPNKRILLFVTLLIFAAIVLKTVLFFLRWKQKKAAAFKPEDTPATETPLGSDAFPTEKAPAIQLDVEEDLVIEEGRLGPGKVPQLLKRCANLPKPVVLHVSKGSSDKLVYFAGGQVSGALTQHSTSEESEIRWNKLGNLLVREEIISEEDRDQAMAELSNQPNLRFGEILLKLGLIDLAGLRHALIRQAKVTIYSLILYPEGRYKIFNGDGSLPPEESVSLEITTLLREASQHQSEWTAIRQALPSLDTSLGFSTEGRKKLENVSLSPQQEATLILIDGNRTINELCVASAMMDYEVYRFLYLMVKAGVLK